MAESIFSDPSITPDDLRLEEALGKTAELWRDLREHMIKYHGEIHHEWKHYNAKSGWILKTYLKKRNLFFLTPLKDFSRITFIFGDKAVAEAEKSGLPRKWIEQLMNARKYAEGRGLSIALKQPADLNVIKTLVRIKIKH